MDFFDLGFLEILVILVVILLVVGPEKLPEYARKFGKMMRNLRKMTRNFTSEMSKSLDLDGELDDLKMTAQDLKGSLDAESQKIKNALDMEADEIAKTIDSEVSSAKKTLTDGTADLSAMLEKESIEFDKVAKEMKAPLDAEARELNNTLNEGMEKVNKSLGVDGISAPKKIRTTTTGKSGRRKTGETLEKLDTVEANEPAVELSPAEGIEEKPADSKPGPQEAGKEIGT